MAKKKGKNLKVQGQVKMAEVREIVLRLPKGKEIPVRIEFFDPSAEVQGQSGPDDFLTFKGGTLANNCGCGAGNNCIC